jgi:hypothetical protein
MRHLLLFYFHSILSCPAKRDRLKIPQQKYRFIGSRNKKRAVAHTTTRLYDRLFLALLPCPALSAPDIAPPHLPSILLGHLALLLNIFTGKKYGISIRRFLPSPYSPADYL